MRVLYDGIAFQNAYQRGIQRVFLETIERLPGDVDAVLALTGQPMALVPARAAVAHVGVPLVRLLPRALRSRVKEAGSRRRLRGVSASCHLFHSTHFTLPPRDMPAVVHVHDMIVERFIDFFQGPWVEEEIGRKRAAIESATHLITISDATARELQYFYPATRGRITTVHLGADHITAPAAPVRSEGATRYALYVGDRSLYKNFAVVLDAMETPRWPAGVNLIVAGPAWKANEAVRIDRLGGTRRIVHAGRPDDAALGALYQASACLLAPALAEGFGLSVLEGQRAGTPVVCADTEVFREVAGEGALFFDPRRPDMLAERVAEALDAGVRTRITEAASRNLARFSWNRTSEQTANVYRLVANRH
jgi:glycosyltransferase involved in cell wall biosynthesis